MVLCNLLYLKNESMDLAGFLHADTTSGKLKITFIIIEEPWWKMGVAF